MAPRMATVSLNSSFYTEQLWGPILGPPITKTSTTFEFQTQDLGFGTFYVRVTGTGLTYIGDEPSGGSYGTI